MVSYRKITDVGLAPSKLSIPATVVMPDDAPDAKREMALNSGLEVLPVPGSDFVDRGTGSKSAGIAIAASIPGRINACRKLLPWCGTGSLNEG
jgi:hypothetical protein